MLLDSARRPAIPLAGRLTPGTLERAARPVEFELDGEVRRRIAECRDYTARTMGDGREVYGATTGFGPLVAFPGRADHAGQCDNAINHLLAGQGQDLPPAVVRAALTVRLWSLCRGRSGVSPLVVDALRAALRTSFAPAVPTYGSVGASGDLIPLAHAARALRGHGHAYLGGERLPAAEALRRAGLTPLELDGRDALALVNGTSVTAAAAALATARLHRSYRTALTLSACLADLLGAAPAFLAPQLLRAFGHPDAVRAAADLRELMAGTVPAPGRPLQEPYSIRCTPQLLGAAAASLGHAGRVIGDDLAGISDNPLFFAEDDLVAHGGNFFGQPVAFAADLLSMTATQLGNLAERQLDLLVDPHRNGGLPPMLAAEPGRQHGVQGVQLAATATVAAMRREAVPASVQSLPTNGHNQDVVPFGTQAALTALAQAERLRWLHGSLAVALRQAAFLSVRGSGRGPSAPRCAAVLERLAAVIAPVDPDRALDEEVRRAADVLDGLGDESADEFEEQQP
ncbi:aromatic amino acid ammonia-lyase [Streptomyces sp. NPDC051183]|uniref:HAL/PAL/TAL family ammonia-lyase n=1 Tax=Streptomyces sp. NPDC051183 TaxID=3155165 RepID=UPI0034205A04